MKIKWIYSCIKNYDKHTAQAIKHFCRRLNSATKLQTICENMRNMSRDEHITLKKDKSNRDKSNM